MPPGLPPVINSSSVVLGPPTGPPTSTSSTAYASYTVVATNTLASCNTQSVVIVNQNFKAPTTSISVGFYSLVTCVKPAVLSVTNAAVTSGVTGAFPIIQSWMGPVPQASLSGSATYSAYAQGMYSVTIKDSYNGCATTATYNVSSNTIAPVLQSNSLTYSMTCGSSNGATISIVPITPTTGLRYYMSNYPPGTAFSNNSITLPAGVTTNSVAVDMVGFFQCLVTNTVNGCYTVADITVTVADQIGGISFSPTPPSCSTCCDGSLAINPPSGFTTYNVSASMGNVTGNPATAITNLCYGFLNYTVTNTANSCFYNGSMTIDGTVDVKEVENNKLFLLYPNPASSSVIIVNLSGKEGWVRILNIEGKEIQKEKLGNEIKINDLVAGVYFVEVNLDNSLFRKKLIVMGDN
jgi:hypothetical protein